MAAPRISSIRRLDALFQRAREPVFLLNGDRRLIYVNRAWEELTGHSAEAVVGLDCRPHGPTRAGDLCGLGGSFCPPPEALAGRPCGGPTLILHAGGERLWKRLEFWPYHDGRGSLLCLFGLVRDSEAPPHAPEAESQRLRSQLLEVRHRLHERHGSDSLIGRGPNHRRLLQQISAAAVTTVPVLILGEPGTGKRTVARTIHQRGPRPQAPLLPFDCSALPAEALERGLFGPADEDATDPARLAVSEGSTVLIGDLLDLPRDLQGRLASSLDGRVRVLATTSGDPERALRDERLRPDLYYALTCLVLRLSPLRERLDELPLLAQHLLERANLRGPRQRFGFSTEALAALLSYDWPGNLRELARVIEDAHPVGPDDLIQVADLPAAIRGHLASSYTPPPLPPPITPLDERLNQLERRLIEQALHRARQNKSRAAELLDISRPRLYRRIKELNIPDEPEPSDDSPPLSAASSTARSGCGDSRGRPSEDG